MPFSFKKKSSQQSSVLETEEIFSDSQGTLEERMEIPIKSRNFVLLYCFITMVALFFLGVLCYYQVFKSSEYCALAQDNHLRTLIEPTARGVIYDQFGEQLVFNELRSDLVLLPQELKARPEQMKEISQFLALILKKPLEQIERELSALLLHQDLNPLILKKNLSHEEILLYEQRFVNDINVGSNFQALALMGNLTRNYIDGEYFSHILGYISQVNQQEFQQKPEYLYFEKVGRAGLESFYQDVLRGLPSRQQIKVNAQREIIQLFNQQGGETGNSLILALDADLQRFSSEVLKNKLDELKLRRGVVIVQNPQNGQLLALVSLPSFDNNLFASGLDDKTYEDLINDPDKPFFNRAIAGLYPPGSSIKPFVGAGVLEENIISPYQIIDCHGGISLVNQYNPEIVYQFRDFNPHGPVDFFSAIAKSCNSYFYITGGGYQDIKGLGVAGIDHYLSLFNFGKITGLDLPGEADGLLPTPEWKKQTKNEDWYTGDTYHLAIGQGDLLITPLQLSVAMSALANGGRLLQPFLVKQIINEHKEVVESFEPVVLNQDFVSQENLGLIKKALRQSVTESFLRSLADLSQPVAGKTGTAQFGSEDKTHAWFVGFGPYEDSQVVVTVLVESGSLGVSAALPIAKQIFKWYFENRL